MKLTRNDMAFIYAGMISIRNYPFDKLNRIIIGRWSLSGLSYIKKRAWKILEELEEMENGH